AHFVLATTEPYKLPPTIRSRTQRFDFHPVGSEVLIGHLSRIAGLEGIRATPEALSLVARHARGSVRDALGLLEQVAALGSGKVDAAGVNAALGLADTETFARLCAAISSQDAPGALRLVAEIAGSGADLRRYAADALEFFRGVFLAQYAPNLEEIVDEPSDVLEEWRAQARALDSSDVLRAIDQLGDALVTLREGREERLVLELTLLRLVRPETASDPVSLAGRMARLEDRVRLLGERSETPAEAIPRAPRAETEPIPTSPPRLELAPEPATASRADQPPSAPDRVVVAQPAADPPAGLDLAAVDTVWPQLVSKVREESGPRRYALFRETRPIGVEGARLVLGIGAHLPFHLAQLQEDDRLTGVVTRAAGELLGGVVTIEYRAVNGDSDPPEDADDDPSEKTPDKDDLDDTGKGAIDPAEMVVDMFDGEIVDE
ncbi:MAG: hypothetical protein ABIJ75_04130, partial [Actinomycetota bacterium]